MCGPCDAPERWHQLDTDMRARCPLSRNRSVQAGDAAAAGIGLMLFGAVASTAAATGVFVLFLLLLGMLVGARYARGGEPYALRVGGLDCTFSTAQPGR